MRFDHECKLRSPYKATSSTPFVENLQKCYQKVRRIIFHCRASGPAVKNEQISVPIFEKLERLEMAADKNLASEKYRTVTELTRERFKTR